MSDKAKVQKLYDNGWRVFRDDEWLYVFPPRGHAKHEDGEEENHCKSDMVYDLVPDLIAALDAATAERKEWALRLVEFAQKGVRGSEFLGGVEFDYDAPGDVLAAFEEQEKSAKVKP